MRRKQDTEHHRCALLGEPWDLVTRFVEGGMFVNFRRALKRCTMISKKHPLTGSYAASIYRLKEEEQTHLIQNYNMIHPLSMFSFYFNMIITIIFLIYFCTIPVVYPLVESDDLYVKLMFPLCTANLIFIIVNFYTGYYDPDHSMVTLNGGKVAKRYLRTYLFFDVLFFVPLLMRITKIRKKLGDNLIYDCLACLRTLLCYVRYYWCLNILKQIRLYYRISTFTFKTIKLLLNIFVLLLLSIYIAFTVMSEIPFYNAKEFLKHSESTLQMLMMVNHGRHTSAEYLTEMFLPVIFILVGFVFHLVIVVETMDICFKYFAAEKSHHNLYNSVDAYMKYRALPVNLRKRIYFFLEFKYEGHFYKETVIGKTTSTFLRREILLAATSDRMQEVDLFFDVPNQILRKIEAILIPQIFLPGDVIIKAGNRGSCMFFLLAGTVSVTSAKGKSICHLRDGAHFGEVALVAKICRVATITAVTPCELFKLDRAQFWDVVKKYPAIMKDIEEVVTERIGARKRSLSQANISIPFLVKTSFDT